METPENARTRPIRLEAERTALWTRQEKERREMSIRHEQERIALYARQEDEMAPR